MSQDTIYGIVADRSSVERVIQALLDAGIPRDHISFLSSKKEEFSDVGLYNRDWREEDRLGDTRQEGKLGVEKHTKAPEGATAGMTAGGIIGGALGLLAGIGALAIPGAGPFIAAGPLLATLGGLGAGGALGGIIGALAGLGIPEYEAERFHKRINEGGILIAVQTNSESSSRTKEILIQHGAEDVNISSGTSLTKDYHKNM